MAPKSKTFGTQKLVARKIQLPKHERQVLAFLEPNSCISGIFKTNFVTRMEFVNQNLLTNYCISKTDFVHTLCTLYNSIAFWNLRKP